MFPAIQVQIGDLDRYASYALALDVVPVNEFRYMFHGSRWRIAGKAANAAAGGGGCGDDVTTRRIYIHPDSPMTGQQWMSKSASFVRLKLTNDLRDSCGYVSISLIQFLSLSSASSPKPPTSISSLRHITPILSYLQLSVQCSFQSQCSRV